MLVLQRAAGTRLLQAVASADTILTTESCPHSRPPGPAFLFLQHTSYLAARTPFKSLTVEGGGVLD